MSLKYEQYRALKETRNLLYDLVSGNFILRKKDLKQMAHDCVKHFPALRESGEPIFSRDDFPLDDEKASGKPGWGRGGER